MKKMTEVGMHNVLSSGVLTNAATGNYNNTATNSDANQQNVDSNSSAAATVETSQTDKNGTQKNAESAQQTAENVNVKPMGEDDVKEMVEKLNKVMKNANANLRFNYHEEAGMFSVALVDKDTNEVIKELPPEEMVKNFVKGKIWMDAFIGTFIDESA
jgi:flagellar protein FlaG